MRKYSLEEIDRMREAVSCMYQQGWAYPPKAETEDKLRTFMQNGTSPEELEQRASEVAKFWDEKHLRKSAI